MGVWIDGVGIARAAGGDDPWDAWVSGRESAPFATFLELRSATESMIRRLKTTEPDGRGAALILATTKGDIEREVEWIRRQAASTGTVDAAGAANDAGAAADAAERWPAPLSHEADHLAQIAGTSRGAYVVSTACSSGLVGMIDAALTILDGDAPRMAVVASDFAGDFVTDGFGALKALTRTRCRPFDTRRDGLTPRSGAAGMILTRHASAQTLAQLSGWGVASDATHMTAPDRDAGGLIRAIRAALAMANLRPADIDVFFAHGTGTRYNDSMEMVAIDAVFGNRPPAITAVKGLIGHTLGASGLIEAALAVRILDQQIVPAAVGLEQPERNDLPFVIAAPRPMRVRHVLKVASGFGGLNAAVILSHATPARTEAP